MAHALRSTTLPHPGTHLTTRDVYSPSTPTYQRRGPEHPRSPPYPGGLRRHPISSMSSPDLGFPYSATNTSTMSSYGAKQQQNIPPLLDMRMHGSLYYQGDPNTAVKPEITGTIDKGFFLADNEWTCYRRNYFSCICSFHIQPPTTHANPVLHFNPSGSSQTYTVNGWAMCISAVVSENDAHAIELVQHTPKRDKGPIAQPDKIRLNPKSPQASHHPMAAYPGGDIGLGGPRGAYENMFAQQLHHQSMQASLPTEHTFERIQFKQATANNGKRRAAQQYYHLVVELYADIGQQAQSGEHFVKIAHRKSAKMIVRGRSPGHYQSERRASTSSGPGGPSAGGMGGYTPGSTMLGGGYGGGGAPIIGGTYTPYDTRSTDHYRSHADAIPIEPILSSEESKGIHEPEKYQYFPTSIIEPHHDPRQPIEMFHHPTSRTQDSNGRGFGNGFDLTSKLYAGPLFSDNKTTLSSGRFKGENSSSGYYPMMMPPSTVGLPRSEMDAKQPWRTSVSPMITSSTS